MLHIGKIEKIISNNQKNNYFTATVTWLDMEGGFYNVGSLSAQVKVSYAHISRSFGFQYYPVPGDVIVCGFLEDGHPIIISYLNADYYSKLVDNNAYGYYFRQLVQGEYSLKGLQGNELYLDRVGSVKFITRNQNQTFDVMKRYEDYIKSHSDSKTNIEEEKLQAANYVTALNNNPGQANSFTVDLTKQVKDIVKTEVTIGKVYDKNYKEEQKLNDKPLALQVIGNDDNEQQLFSLKINEEGEIELKRTDSKYNITIDKEGNISLIGTTIQLQADQIILNGEPGVKGNTLKNWCDTHVHSKGDQGSPTGPATIQLPQSALTKK